MGSSVDMSWQYIALAVVNFLILGPISISLLWKYKIHVDRHEHIYTARRPGLVLLQGIIAVVFMCLYLPLHIIVFELWWDNNGTLQECTLPSFIPALLIKYAHLSVGAVSVLDRVGNWCLYVCAGNSLHVDVSPVLSLIL